MSELPFGDPFEFFRHWFAEAEATEPNDPNAMALATADTDGQPSVRMVLLKSWDVEGFVFYSNLTSLKGRHLASNPRAGLLFHWKSRRRQVRIDGPVELVEDAEADAYFASRPRTSRLGAWASKQSQSLEGRFALETRVAYFAMRHPVGVVPRPPHWSGYRVRPQVMEFWQDGPFRLHDRWQFSKRTDPETGADSWQEQRLYP